MFFIIGPSRTGSSLLSRCIDDHPECLCLCESEIQRVIYKPHLVHLHYLRMLHHGLTPLEISQLLDRKEQQNFPSIVSWYAEIKILMTEKHSKRESVLMGDKHPFAYLHSELVEHALANWKLVYTIRDPRSIYSSIVNQNGDGCSEREKQSRWEGVKSNFLFWLEHLDRKNILVQRYEDLIEAPENSMRKVYEHLGVCYSSKFSEEFERLYPSRFLWKTAVDWKTGHRKSFDKSKITDWKRNLSEEEIQTVQEDETAGMMISRFGYE